MATATRTARNRAAKSRLKSARKAALTAIAGNDSKAAQTSISSAISLASRAAKSNVVHKNAVSRLQSRLAKAGELEIGIRPVEGGLFSNWAAQTLKAGAKQDLPFRFAVERPEDVPVVGL